MEDVSVVGFMGPVAVEIVGWVRVCGRAVSTSGFVMDGPTFAWDAADLTAARCDERTLVSVIGKKGLLDLGVRLISKVRLLTSDDNPSFPRDNLDAQPP